MKALRLVLITSMCLALAQLAKAQVKIGDNPLDITTGRHLEIEKSDTFLIVTDDVQFGRTGSRSDNATSDALMIKLFGYGLDTKFYPASISQPQQTATLNGVKSNVFMGITDDGQLMEVPIRLDIQVSEPDTNGTLAFYNGLDTFGQVDLRILDTMMAFDYELQEALTFIDMQIDADGDTLTSNEYVDSLYITDDTLWVRENGPAEQGATNLIGVDIGAYLDANTFYRADGDFDENRSVDGAGFNLQFTNLDSFRLVSTSITNLSSPQIDLTAGDTIDIDAGDAVKIDANEIFLDQGGTTVMGINSTQEVKFASSSVDSILFLDDTGVIKASEYGDGPSVSNFATIIGALPDGTLVDIDVDDVLARQIDSTIYNNDGTLTGDRTLTGASNDLTFTGLSDFDVTATDGVSFTTDTVVVTGENRVSGLSDSDDAVAYNSIIGATADGTLINVDPADILSTQIDSTIYNNNGTLTGDRTLTGASNDLTFAGLSDFDVSAADGVSFTTDTVAVTGETRVSGLGDTDDGITYNSIVGATADGTLINIDASDILSTQTDSTIYNFDGTLTGDRTLTGGTNDLTFTDLSEFNITVTDSVEINGEVRISGLDDADDGTTFASIVGATADGSLINVTADDILATQEDSTIYTHDGTLTGERTMTMGGNNLFFVSDSGSDTTAIDSSGRMIIGGGTFTNGAIASNVKLEVKGDILAVQIHSSSDRRFKKNISPVEGALRKVMGLEGVNYDFRTDEFANRNFPEERQLGFIAQDIEEFLPEVVRTNGDGYKAVDYSKVTALLVEAMKEQQQQIETLKGQLAEATDTNQGLAKEIASIKAMLQGVSNLNVADED